MVKLRKNLVSLTDTFNPITILLNISQVYFPSGSLQKKIKVALQIQNVPETVLSYVWPEEDLRVSPLVAIEPRRRRFHCPVQVMLYLPQVKPNASLKNSENMMV